MRFFTRHWYDRIQAHFFADAPLTDAEADKPAIA
jgi:hypothetical protein